VGIDTDEEKREVYDKYMDEGIPLGQISEPTEKFSPQADVRLNLGYAVQCVPSPGHGKWDQRAKFRSEAADKVELVYGEYVRLANDAEYTAYRRRKWEESCRRLHRLHKY
jgi:hypothetical protein